MALRRANNRQNVLLGRRVDEARRQMALSYADLGEKAGYSERTIRNFILGKPTRPKTRRDICEAVDVDTARETTRHVKAADIDHGEYTRDQLKNYLGLFFAYRRSFDVQENLIRSIFQLEWDDQAHCMRFYEHHSYYSKRLGKHVNYDQHGDVFISNAIGLVHLLTREKGAIRLITLTKLHHEDLVMSGAVLTQMEQPGNHFQPSSSPIYLQKIASNDLSELKRFVGPIEPHDSAYLAINGLLDRTQNDVVNYSLGPSPR